MNPPENFAVRLILCILLLLLIWNGSYYLMHVVVWHEAFEFDAMRQLIMPIVCGVVMAFTWKPKAQ